MDAERLALAKEAREAATECRSIFWHYGGLDDGLNKMILRHEVLFRKLACALTGPNDEDAVWDELDEKVARFYGFELGGQ